MFGKRLWATVSLLVIVAMLVSCAPEVIKETVVVTQVVEKVVTEIIEKTVKETIIVEGTPQVVERVVTQVVEKEVTVIVTPTPPKVTLKLATWAGVDEANELQDILDRLNAASDTYEIVQESSPSEYWTKLQTTIAAGTAADLMWVDQDHLPDFAQKGALLDLTDRIEADDHPAGDAVREPGSRRSCGLRSRGHQRLGLGHVPGGVHGDDDGRQREASW